ELAAGEQEVPADAQGGMVIVLVVEELRLGEETLGAVEIAAADGGIRVIDGEKPDARKDLARVLEARVGEGVLLADEVDDAEGGINEGVGVFAGGEARPRLDRALSVSREIRGEPGETVVSRSRRLAHHDVELAPHGTAPLAPGAPAESGKILCRGAIKGTLLEREAEVLRFRGHSKPLDVPEVVRVGGAEHFQPGPRQMFLRLERRDEDGDDTRRGQCERARSP